jgi:hypothetical protein
MGKRKFAGTLRADEHSTTANKYGNNLDAWIRGWDYGVEVTAYQVDGEDVFELHVVGGSTEGRGRKQFLGIVNSTGFVRATV